jgi:transcriptional regulator with XRE-family HTH domain
MGAHLTAVQRKRIKAKAEKVQAKMLKELIRHIPHHWDGQCALANEAGVSPQTLWSWVEGRTISPRINTMVKVATALGYSIELVKPQTKLRLVSKR